MSVTLNEGLAYVWQGATWRGTSVFESRELDRLLGVAPGEVADGIKLDKGLVDVSRAYGRKGYLSIHTSVTPAFADHSASARYDIAVTDGPRFHMRSIAFPGASPAVAKELSQRWRLQTGAVYDTDYVSEFLDDVRKNAPLLLTGATSMDVSVTPRPPTTLVDVKLTLR